MKTGSISTCAVVAWLVAGGLALADDPAASKPSSDQVAVTASALKWQTGTVSIRDGLAKINLSDDFRFIGSDDARKVLHDIWGNPDDPHLLGMIFPKNLGPLDRASWAVTVNYEEGGYVKDDDAAKVDYAALLKTMQQDAKDANVERVKEGYRSVELVGWAAPPRYDAATHKLYWAKDLKFGGEPGDTLNYDIRILGRRGVLVLGAIASMRAFPLIREKMPMILAMIDFQPGNTYAEFNPKVDKVAAYGLAALVAGGALAGAAKLGLFGLFFKYIIVVVLALKKAILVVVVAAIAGAKKLWSKMTGGKAATRTLTPPPPGPPYP